MKNCIIKLGDCLELLKKMPDNYVTSIITDPPYGLTSGPTQYLGEGNNSGGFMGKSWDHGVPGVSFWKEMLRVTKPGGMLLSFGGTRTWHRLGCAIEDAGWEIRDCIMWVYGSGFPKSLNISKAVDKQAGRLFSGKSIIELKQQLIKLFDASGKNRKIIDEECGFRACNYLTLPREEKCPDPWINILPSQEKWKKIKKVIGCDENTAKKLDSIFAAAEREVLGQQTKARAIGSGSALPTLGATTEYKTWDITAPATDEAKLWAGWGTALKPAWEPIIVARRPLEGTVVENVLKHGTGALNIDGCRIEYPKGDDALEKGLERAQSPRADFRGGIFHTGVDWSENKQTVSSSMTSKGRWPANVIHDGSEEVVDLFPQSSGKGGDSSGQTALGQGSGWNKHNNRMTAIERRNDAGSAARFFYTAKTSRKERNLGCENLFWLDGKQIDKDQWIKLDEENKAREKEPGYVKHKLSQGNIHPTVKPLAIMRWLCRLISPPKDGIILDPFMGSGSTGIAALLEGQKFIGIEKELESFIIAQARIENYPYDKEVTDEKI